MAEESAGRTQVRQPNPTSQDHGCREGDHHAPDSGERLHYRWLQCRDAGARALRAVFSSHDNWPNLSEAERDEWRGYFDRMLEWLERLGYTPERNPCSLLLEGSTIGHLDESASKLTTRQDR